MKTLMILLMVVSKSSMCVQSSSFPGGQQGRGRCRDKGTVLSNDRQVLKVLRKYGRTNRKFTWRGHFAPEHLVTYTQTLYNKMCVYVVQEVKRFSLLGEL